MCSYDVSWSELYSELNLASFTGYESHIQVVVRVEVLLVEPRELYCVGLWLLRGYDLVQSLDLTLHSPLLRHTHTLLSLKELVLHDLSLLHIDDAFELLLMLIVWRSLLSTNGFANSIVETRELVVVGDLNNEILVWRHFDM